MFKKDTLEDDKSLGSGEQPAKEDSISEHLAAASSEDRRVKDAESVPEVSTFLLHVKQMRIRRHS